MERGNGPTEAQLGKDMRDGQLPCTMPKTRSYTMGCELHVREMDLPIEVSPKINQLFLHSVAETAHFILFCRSLNMLKAESSDGLFDLVRRCRPLDRAEATRFPGMRRVLEIRPSGRGWCVIEFHFVHSPKAPMSGIRPRRWGESAELCNLERVSGVFL